MMRPRLLTARLLAFFLLALKVLGLAGAGGLRRPSISGVTAMCLTPDAAPNLQHRFYNNCPYLSPFHKNSVAIRVLPILAYIDLLSFSPHSPALFGCSLALPLAGLLSSPALLL